MGLAERCRSMVIGAFRRGAPGHGSQCEWRPLLLSPPPPPSRPERRRLALSSSACRRVGAPAAELRTGNAKEFAKSSGNTRCPTLNWRQNVGGISGARRQASPGASVGEPRCIGKYLPGPGGDAQETEG
ncbi:hypothetical protein NDU88_004346 [Pleurodeles waltl]|uniref:Uncharacterized protein n=1 Tax=Pleurodeles waltl TaxID=8319 RepID=A0AAV7T8I2_PLEWA|nr:hypothetical protein NDU88_004346 [Pleurodeles waltl]